MVVADHGLVEPRQYQLSELARQPTSSPALVKQLVVDVPVALHRHVVLVEHGRLDHSIGDLPDITTEKLKRGK